MRRLSPWHLSRLFAEFKRSGSVAKAAEAAHCSKPAAYRYLGKFIKPQGYRSALQREALRLYASGLSTWQVAAALVAHCEDGERHPSAQTVWEWVESAGIARTKSQALTLRMSKKSGKDYLAIRRQVRRLAEEKLWSAKKIAEYLGVSKGVARRAMPLEYRCDPSEATERRAWQAYLPDVERRRALRDEVIARREKGETYVAIAAATGLSKPTIWSYCKRAGLTKPTKRWASKAERAA